MQIMVIMLIFKIVDTTGFTGYPPGTVLNQFITSWFVPIAVSENFDMIYPAKLISGLTARIVYTSTGSNDVFIAINYKLHKVLF